MTNIKKDVYHVIGLMSGTSLDGLDIAYCRLECSNNRWQYDILAASTIAYPAEWKQKLISLETADALTFQQAHVDYGLYLGQRVSDFIVINNCKADFVSSHGHTIFHQPDKKLTVQIGSGPAIASRCKLPVVSDFRSLDVLLGGQGAPLVPVGDMLLFNDYEYCLNLGGFSNVSYQHQGERIAYDICPVNIVMNAICQNMGMEYDDQGLLARQGMLSHYFLNELNQLAYYKQTPNTPKSLGKEWVVQNIFPLIDRYEMENSDLLHTYCHHIATQTAKALNPLPKGKVLATGGGVYNTFLMECIQQQTQHTIVIPPKKLIEYKEALVFAFLGVLRMRLQPNCLKSVTGAYRDNCGGSVVG